MKCKAKIIMCLNVIVLRSDREIRVPKRLVLGPATTIINIHYELSKTLESNGPNYGLPCVIVPCRPVMGAFLFINTIITERYLCSD